MGMSTHVIGFRPPDARWKKMKAVYDACIAAETTPPKEVMEFFGHEDPDDSGVEVEIEDTDAVSEYSDEYSAHGYEIDIRKLPKDVHILRFYNSY